MINAEYLFDKKIVWVGDKNICTDNIDDFINKLTDTLKFLGVYTDSINNSLRHLKRDISLEEGGGCLQYLRFLKTMVIH